MSDAIRNARPAGSAAANSVKQGVPHDLDGAGHLHRAAGFFALAAEAARVQFDPAEQWDEFVAALWHQI